MKKAVLPALPVFAAVAAAPGGLPACIGVGGRIRLAGGARDEQKLRLGARVPFGLEYLFDGPPVGLFLEIAPLLDLLPGTGFGVNGAIGARWYFR
jgi:hypothetical protein